MRQERSLYVKLERLVNRMRELTDRRVTAI